MRRALVFLASVVMYLPLHAQKPELVVETGHTGSVHSVAFSPDGRVLASASSDKTVKLWEVATGRELRTLAGHAGGVNSIAFSPDGRLLASGSFDFTLKLWEVATGREVRSFNGHSSSVESIAFSPDGRCLASSSQDHTVKLWEVSTGRELRTLNAQTYYLSPIAFNPNGRLLATGSSDGVELWDVSTGTKLRVLAGHKEGVFALAFSPDGSLLASGSHDMTAKLWDVATGQELRTLVGHTVSVNTVAFSPDGRLLATGSGGQTIRLWEVATGRNLNMLTGHTGRVDSVAFSPDGLLLASGSGDETVKLWDPATGHEIRTLTGNTTVAESVAFSPDGRVLASGRWDKTLKLWNVAAGRDLRTLISKGKGVRSIAFSPDGSLVAAGNWDQTVKLWDASTGSELRTWAANSRGEIPTIAFAPFTVAFSPNGRLLASAGFDMTVKLWDVATGRELKELTDHPSVVNSVAFSPDGSLLASASDNTVKLWDVATGQGLRTLEDQTWLESVAFSPDGALLASAGHDNTVRLWEVATGLCLRTLTGHNDTVNSIAFSPDGNLLASASEDMTVKLWQVSTGRELRTLTGDVSPVEAVTFSPNGRFLATSDRSGSLLLWDVGKGMELARLVALGPNDWAVLDKQGRFDASPGGMELMHWVVGTETISLSQLKDRYFEPGLLAKVLGFSQDPLREVSAFSEVKLFPEVSCVPPVPGSTMLKVRLKNRGGGIGRVQVFVNGKEVRGPMRRPRAGPPPAEVTLNVDLSGSHFKPGENNEIRVVSWNEEGYLSSRESTVTWKPQGQRDVSAPELYAVVAGISEYSSPSLQLGFAATDAQDFAHALQLGGSRLFGADHVHIQLLATLGKPGVPKPTKANLKTAFESVRHSRPSDVFVVYLAGHGVAIHDIYAYPTQEARTLDLADPSLRNMTSITSEELVGWLNAIPATHQVMVLDTCAAGAAQKKLVEKRDVPGDQIRAIDRLKGSTGFHVLMGAAADASSYETSEYGQGLLTYSLLAGMRGAALREEKYVDVSRLFQYAADEVPQLARNIGGIQKPLILVPKDSTSFDMGKLETEDKQAIPLALVKPLILRPLLLNLQEGTDSLHLVTALRARLRDTSYVSARGGQPEPKTVFVDEDEFPGAIRPTGFYTIEDQQVKVTLVLSRDGKKVKQLDVSGPEQDVPGLAEKMVAAMTQAIVEIPNVVTP